MRRSADRFEVRIQAVWNRAHIYDPIAANTRLGPGISRVQFDVFAFVEVVGVVELEVLKGK